MMEACSGLDCPGGRTLSEFKQEYEGNFLQKNAFPMKTVEDFHQALDGFYLEEPFLVWSKRNGVWHRPNGRHILPRHMQAIGVELTAELEVKG